MEKNDKIMGIIALIIGISFGIWMVYSVSNIHIDIEQKGEIPIMIDGYNY